MKNIKSGLGRAAGFVLVFTVICGLIYTLAITGIAQLIFPDKANGSIIEVDGKKYGCELLGQQYTDDTHMWGRIMQVSTSAFTDKDGKKLMYAFPSNLSPASDEYEELVSLRVDEIKTAHPEQGDKAIPVDLVTSSGSGLDPSISVAAAEYQKERLAKNNNMTVDEMQKIIDKCTNHRFLGIFGEETVNVLKVNLMVDGILE